MTGTAIAEQPEPEGFWTPYRDVLSDVFYDYLPSEAEARTLHCYQREFPHGLTQTREYADALIRALAPERTRRTRLRQLDLRMARQRLFDRPGVQVGIVLDAAALLRRPAPGPDGEAIMRRQLGRLLELNQRPTVTIQVLPFDRSLRAAAEAPFNLLQAPSGGWRVYLERLPRGASVFSSDPGDVHRYRTRWQELTRAAVDLPHALPSVRWPA